MMKSSDMEKVEVILKKIRRLKVDVRFLNEAKQEGIDDSYVRINHRLYEMDVSIVQTILDKISSEMNGYVEELKQLGVEYVDETA